MASHKRIAAHRARTEKSLNFALLKFTDVAPLMHWRRRPALNAVDEKSR
jgi:hypothetical protein